MNERRFRPSEAHRLDDPERATFLPAGRTVDRLGLAPGMIVADIGAGTGYFSRPMAVAVAPGGKVLAIDVQHEMLALLRERLAAPDAPPNIAPVEGDAAATGLPDAVCDLVFMANLWHELDDRAAALEEIRRILRPGGRLAILDWKPEAPHPPGPPIRHRIPRNDVIAMVTSHGWSLLDRAETGSYSYLLLFEPDPSTRKSFAG